MIDLSNYVTNTESNIYGLVNLPEEVIAVLFAYYSRSAGSLKDNLLKLLKDDELAVTKGEFFGNNLPLAVEKAKKFHEKWVIEYGHASVAEHAVAHIAVERISILLSKVIEDSRLASFTEKSSRFVFFEGTDFYPLNELGDKALLKEYKETTRSLIQDYRRAYEQIFPKIASSISKSGKELKPKEQMTCKRRTCDIVRYLLPTATYTNLGMTVNGRELAHVISKLLSNPLSEANECGKKIKEEGMKIIPTLIKYVSEKEYLMETPQRIREIADGLELKIDQDRSQKPVILVEYQDNAETMLAASILYEHKGSDFVSILDDLESRNIDFIRNVIDEYLKRRGEHDQPLRNLEHISYTFDILIDYGAFRDIQRHRIATQTSQLFTSDYGYSKPDEIEEFGLSEIFERAMSRGEKLHRKMKELDPYIAQYALPMAFRKRVLFTWNLRELHHFVSLRSSPAGHPSYRKIANDIYDEIERVHPFLAKYMRVTRV